MGKAFQGSISSAVVRKIHGILGIQGVGRREVVLARLDSGIYLDLLSSSTGNRNNLTTLVAQKQYQTHIVCPTRPMGDFAGGTTIAPGQK